MLKWGSGSFGPAGCLFPTSAHFIRGSKPALAITRRCGNASRKETGLILWALFVHRSEREGFKLRDPRHVPQREAVEADEYCCTLETTFDPLPNTVRYVEKPTDNVCWGRENISTEEGGEVKMTTTRGSAHYAGLLPVEPSDEPPPIRPTTLENDPLPNRQPSLRNRAPRALSRFLIAFCSGIAATLAWWSYGDAARQVIASSYPHLGWLAPQPGPAQNAPNMITFAAPATPSFDQQLSAMSLDLNAVRQSIDRIAAGQEQLTRSIDQIAPGIATGQEQTTLSGDQSVPGIATGQEQMTGSSDQSATGIGQAPPARASGITVESRADGASPQPTARLDIKPAEARPPQSLSETGKQLSVPNGYDASCFPSASAVAQNHPGGWPIWTFRAPGHEGTICWYAAARPRGSDHRPRVGDHRSEMAPRKERVGTIEDGLSAQAAPPGRFE
jgi:hypothetical protein